MIRRYITPRVALAVLAWLCALPAGLAQNMTQTITLQPGWKAPDLGVTALVRVDAGGTALERGLHPERLGSGL